MINGEFVRMGTLFPSYDYENNTYKSYFMANLWTEQHIDFFKNYTEMASLYFSRAKYRIVSPFIEDMVNESTKEFLRSDAYAFIARALSAKFADKWAKLYSDMVTEYNQLKPYSYDEEIEQHRDADNLEETAHGKTVDDDTTFGKTTTTTFGKVQAETDTYGKTHTTTFGKTVSDELVRDQDETTTYGKGESTTTTHGLVVTEAPTGTNQVQDTQSHMGFNSSAFVPVDQQNRVETPGVTNTTTNSGQDVAAVTRSGSDTHANDVTDTREVVEGGAQTESNGGSDTKRVTDSGSQADADSGTEQRDYREGGTTAVNSVIDEDSTRERHVSGSMGYKSPAEYLMEDVNFWQASKFVDIVFDDIDSVLTLPIF